MTRGNHPDNPFYEFNRWMDGEPPGFPEAHIALIDALSDYLRRLKQDDRDFAEEGYEATEEQERDHNRRVQMATRLLKELQSFEIFPWVLEGKNG